MRIALVGPARMPIAPPFGGGLEVFVHRLRLGLMSRGVQVHLFAARGSEGHRPELELPPVDWTACPDGARDDRYPPGGLASETAAYHRLREHLERGGYDLVHNNSVNPALLRQPCERVPMLTTLHTPPEAPLQQAVDASGPAAGRFSAVSAFTAGQWRLPSPARVIANGVDTSEWRMGPGGRGAVWFGRLTREKAPHLAIRACRDLGLPLTLIGRCADPEYMDAEVAPLLDDRVRWLGPLPPEGIADQVGRSRLALVTPEWDEPFGLVLIEALSCGTPVAAFRRGGVPEILRETPEHLAEPGDVQDLVRAAHAALEQPRHEARQIAVERFELSGMIERYCELYQEAAAC